MIKVIFSFIVGIILILVALFALDHWIIFNKKENIDKLLGISTIWGQVSHFNILFGVRCRILTF
jgi:Na+-driven multidrug efflux pump